MLPGSVEFGSGDHEYMVKAIFPVMYVLQIIQLHEWGSEKEEG